MRLSALLLSLAATPGLAQDYLAFQSPSGNIHCGLWLGQGAGARCDLFELQPSFTERPADCAFDWGRSFAVDEDSVQGYLACVSDTVADPENPVLGYGQTARLGPFACRSETTGVTCQNALGHGFAVARAAQHLF